MAEDESGYQLKSIASLRQQALFYTLWEKGHYPISMLLDSNGLSCSPMLPDVASRYLGKLRHFLQLFSIDFISQSSIKHAFKVNKIHALIIIFTFLQRYF